MFFVLKSRAKHINDLKERRKKSSALTLGWSASQILAGLPVLEVMEQVAQSLVL